MIILIFSILIITFLVIAEQYAIRNRLQQIRTEYYPEKQLADQGEDIVLCVTVKNSSSRPIPYLRLRTALPKHLLCQADERIILRKSYGETELTWSTWVSGKSAVAFSIPIQAKKRGQYVLGQLRITDGNFLGNAEESRMDPSFSEIVIAPTESDDPDIPSQVGSFLGQLSVRRYLYEDPILTVGHRAYTGQEPMKMIDWMQSAKGQGLMVRNYDHTTDAEVIVMLDVGSECKSNDIEECYRIARTVCRILEEKAFPYRLVMNSRFDMLMTQFAQVSASSMPTAFSMPTASSMPAASSVSGISSVLRTSFGLGQAHFQSILELLGRALNQRSLSLDEMLAATLAEDGFEKSIILITPIGSAGSSEGSDASSGNSAVWDPEEVLSHYPMLLDHLLLLRAVSKGGAGQ